MTITNYFYIIDTLHDDDYMYMAYYLAIFPRQQNQNEKQQRSTDGAARKWRLGPGGAGEHDALLLSLNTPDARAGPTGAFSAERGGQSLGNP